MAVSGCLTFVGAVVEVIVLLEEIDDIFGIDETIVLLEEVDDIFNIDETTVLLEEVDDILGIDETIVLLEEVDDIFGIDETTVLLEEVGDIVGIDETMGSLKVSDGLLDTDIVETTVSFEELNDVLDRDGVDMTVSLDVKDIFGTDGIDDSGVDMTDCVGEAFGGTEDVPERNGGDADESFEEAVDALGAFVDKGVADRMSATEVEEVADSRGVGESICDCWGEKTEPTGE